MDKLRLCYIYIYFLIKCSEQCKLILRHVRGTKTSQYHSQAGHWSVRLSGDTRYRIQDESVVGYVL